MECQEGLSDVPGAWGGYNYAGCIGTNEYGAHGSLVRFNDSVKEEGRIYTTSGSQLGVFGLVWECLDPMDFELTGPPISFDHGCWYYDDDMYVYFLLPQPDDADYEKNYTLVSLNGTSVHLYCLYNSYSEEFWPKNVYILYSEDEELYHSAKTTYPPPSTTSTTTTTPSGYWYEQYLYTPCEPTSPILKNEEHDATQLLNGPKVFPAESYYLECQEGMSNVTGAWGGYYYGGCIGTNEYGVNGSLVSLNGSEDVWTYAGNKVDQFGIGWICVKYLSTKVTDSGIVPPLAANYGCWYYNAEGVFQLLSPRPYEEEHETNYANMTLNGETFRLYCIEYFPYGIEFNRDAYYELLSEDDALEKWKTTPAQG